MGENKVPSSYDSYIYIHRASPKCLGLRVNIETS